MAEREREVFLSSRSAESIKDSLDLIIEPGVSITGLRVEENNTGEPILIIEYEV